MFLLLICTKHTVGKNVWSKRDDNYSDSNDSILCNHVTTSFFVHDTTLRITIANHDRSINLTFMESRCSDCVFRVNAMKQLYQGAIKTINKCIRNNTFLKSFEIKLLQIERCNTERVRMMELFCMLFIGVTLLAINTSADDLKFNFGWDSFGSIFDNVEQLVDNAGDFVGGVFHSVKDTANDGLNAVAHWFS